ncbi:MAG: hypothetical protein AAGD32_18220 [Planctomycetota bacterium]
MNRHVVLNYAGPESGQPRPFAVRPGSKRVLIAAQVCFLVSLVLPAFHAYSNNTITFDSYIPGIVAAIFGFYWYPTNLVFCFSPASFWLIHRWGKSWLLIAGAAVYTMSWCVTAALCVVAFDESEVRQLMVGFWLWQIAHGLGAVTFIWSAVGAVRK